jgi:hypothetical protein
LISTKCLKRKRSELSEKSWDSRPGDKKDSGRKKMKTQRFKMLVLATLLLFAYSCATRIYYLAPEEIGKTASDKSLIIKLNDGSSVRLTNVSLEEGGLIGFTEEKIKREIDLSSIQSVQIKKGDYYFVALGVGVVVVAAWLAIGASTAPSPPPSQSCPFIYSFDGERYVLDAEPYGGAICQGLERTEWSGLEHLRESNGLYRILITNELDETQYTDELKLVVVDHQRGVKVAPDAAGKIHTFARPLAPLSAVQNQERDILSLINEKDSRVWQSRYEEKSSRIKEDLREELIFEFPKPRDAQKAKLLVNASTDVWGSHVAKEFLTLFGNKISDWYSDVNARGPEFHKVMSWYLREELYLLQVKVETPSGWKPRGIIYGGGPFISEDKAYTLDIGDVPGETLRIKLTPPTHFWNIDYLAVDYSEDADVDAFEIAPASSGAWGDPAVYELLAADDERYLIMPTTGDSAELVFLAPPLKPGFDRSIMLRANGYYDIHLQAQGEPQTDLIKTIFTEPGSTLKYALKIYEIEKEKLKEK